MSITRLNDSMIQGTRTQTARRRVYGRDFKLAVIQRLDQGSRAAQIARDLGVSRSIISRWMRESRNNAAQAFRGNGRRAALQGKVEELKREGEKLRVERDLLKKASSRFCPDTEVLFGFIAEHREVWPVRWMCEILEVSSSGYYEWVKRSAQTQVAADATLQHVS